ncbi:hypothetical protein Glove_64g127 [Diversispora epigaea]|uniref:Uncharacterized protein n=1 Tax=Diversispora epigaea TaxID=1348612 RepID=A0A397JEK4_9GLOM|nr:hypothetical protein Glove_64g127 [Diversispora epigaea]
MLFFLQIRKPPEVEPPQIESPHPQSSGSSIQSFKSDDSITPLSSVSNVRARSDDDNQKKLCKLKEDMKSIKEKISVLSFNKEFLDVIIKKFSEELIKHSIYPIPGDYKEMTEEVLRKTNNDFFLSLSDHWDGYFEKKMKKAAIKASIFKIFDKLPPINSNATAAEITAWKRSPIVLECYKKLFTEIENTSEKYIVRIIKMHGPKKNSFQILTLPDDNGDDDDDYNNNNNNDYNNDDYNNNNNDYNDYNNNNVNNEDDFQIIEDDRRFTNN